MTDENLSIEEDYDNLKVDLVNLFGKKKFSNKQFNKIFEWNKYKNSEKDQFETSKQLIHKTTDGFSSYNSGVIENNCSLVSSYNGLMIAGDDLGERGIGYWGNNYSDYSIVHKGVRNPVKKPKIPRKFSIDEYIENSKKVIDDHKLDETSRDTPKLHAKYLQWLAEAKLAKKREEFKQNTLVEIIFYHFF